MRSTPHRGPLLLALAGALLPLATSCSEAPADGLTVPKHVFLISLDTLRYDHVGFNGYDQPTTPFLDTLAERGVVFDDHIANSNCTLPSHASMLTGLLPPSHGVRITTEVGDPLHVLSPSIVTVAERFQEAGYATAAFTAHAAWLNEEYGFDQGFDHFETGWREAPETIERFLALVDERQAERSFNFLHFFDIHSDDGNQDPRHIYNADPDHLASFVGSVPPDFTGRNASGSSRASSWLAIQGPHNPLPESHRQYLINSYDAGIATLDRHLERLFGELEQRGILDESLLVITSDHGESMGEHGTYLHEGFRTEVSQVPLLVVLPPAFEVAPHRVAARTQSTDLVPTMLELCRLDPVGETRSLTDAILFGDGLDDSKAMFESNVLFGTDDVGDYVVVRTGSYPVFIDKDQDPRMTVNLTDDPDYVAEHKDRIVAAETVLLEILEKAKRRNALILEGVDLGEATLDPARVAELQQLGYL